MWILKNNDMFEKSPIYKIYNTKEMPKKGYGELFYVSHPSDVHIPPYVGLGTKQTDLFSFKGKPVEFYNKYSLYKSNSDSIFDSSNVHDEYVDVLVEDYNSDAMKAIREKTSEYDIKIEKKTSLFRKEFYRVWIGDKRIPKILDKEITEITSVFTIIK